jgi:hypothetical protein
MMRAEDYPIAIRRGDKGYIAEAAALGLARTGMDISVLEADMRAAVGEILQVCERHGARIDPMQAKESVVGAPSRRYAVGAMIVVLFMALLSMPILWGFQRLSAVVASSSDQITSARIQKILTASVQKTADTLEMITPERRDQLARDFGRIARALEPYAVQLRPLLTSSSATATPALPVGRQQ